MNESGLLKAVQRLARVTQGLTDEEMGREWSWRYHSEGLRFALLGSYHELRDLAVRLAAARTSQGVPITAVQRALAQYHAAYRDLGAILLGTREEEMDRPPAEGEWPLRRILGHIIGADRAFFSLIDYAVEQHRAGEEPSRMPDEYSESLVGSWDSFEQMMESEGLEGILGHYETLHGQILTKLAGLNEAEANAPSVFWEGEPLQVSYRLHRFDAHLRQHTVQAEKTLAAIGHPPNEAKRLLRLVYNALAEAEGALIGNWDLEQDQRRELASTIEARAAEVASIVTS